MEYGEELIKEILDFDSDRSTKWERERKPYSAIFELTSRCNMNCVHCYLKNLHSEHQLTTQRVFEILDILHDNSILFLTLTGGEILTRSDFAEIYMYAKRKGFFVELFTNAYLFNDDTIELLKKYPPMLVDVSLYGGCEETCYKITGIKGAFRKVLDNCRKLKEAGIRVAFKSPVMKESYADLPAMRKIAEDMDIEFRPSFEIIPTVDGDLETKNRQLTLKDILMYEFEEHNKNEVNNDTAEPKALREKGNPYIFDCKIGVSSFLIDYMGNMCPCMKLRHRGVGLNKDNFEEIWASYEKYKKMEFPQGHKCRDCKVREYCEVCPAERDYINNDMLFRCAEDCRNAMARADFYLRKKSADEIIREYC